MKTIAPENAPPAHDVAPPRDTSATRSVEAILDDVPALDDDDISPLGLARARRKLTIEEIADEAGLTVEAVEALERSRLYRFPSQREAIAAAILYSSALGISQREARQLAGLPLKRRLLERWSIMRIGAGVVFAGAAALLAWFVVVPRLSDEPSAADPAASTLLPAPELEASLPEPWEIEVDVLNGSTTPRAATRLADKIAGLTYQIRDVTNAPRDDYPETRVYYTPGSAGVAQRLGDQLGITIQELPGGDEPRRLVVIAGAEVPLE